MSTTLIPPAAPTVVAAPTVPPASARAKRTLAHAITAASDAVLGLSLADPRWAVVGPLLTDVVDAVRRGAGLTGSSIGPHDDVSPALRLRDLGQVAVTTIRSADHTVTTPEVEQGVRSLLAAVGRGPSGA